MATLQVMGCDPHLDTITAAVVDRTGGELTSATVPNTSEGWKTITGLCRSHHVGLVGVEAASGYGRRLAETLTGAGVEVREIPTRLTARTRRVDGAGKTDPGDARTIARAAARGEGHQWRDQQTHEALRVLTHRRNHLVEAQTADINNLRALLAEIDPEQAAGMGRIRSKKRLTELTTLVYEGDIHQKTVSQVINQIAQTCLDRRNQINQLETQIREVMPAVGWKLINTIQGCGLIVAAQLLSELAGTVHNNHAKMAAWAGVAPLDVSSGRQQRHRLNPGGNRQANRAIHTIVVTQLRRKGLAHSYITRRTTEGKTRNEAIRAAKRHITRHIWKTLRDHKLT